MRRASEAKRAGLFKVAKKRRAIADKAREDLQGLMDSVQRDNAAAKTLLSSNPPTLADVQKQLAKDDLLVSYSVIGIDSCALIVTKDSARIVALTNRKEIQESISAAVFADPDEDPSEILKALHEALIKPLGIPSSTKRMLISPNAVVAQVPFGALLPELDIVHLPSVVTALRLRGSDSKSEKHVLALGDPVYKSDWEPLPHTRAEAKAIGSKVLLGEDATRTKLESALAERKTWRAVHIACHGVVDSENPSLSGLALTDGRMTAFDILQLRVPATLVTLSACETGRGKAVRGEGVLGLTRSFLATGASQVMVSLWPVAPLAPSTTYELVVPAGGITDLVGNPSTEAFSATFTTVACEDG